MNKSTTHDHGLNKGSRFSFLKNNLYAYANPFVIKMFLLSFVAGLPLPLLISTLSFRLREAHVDRALIGYFAWIALIYSVKWLWSPCIDHYRLVFTRYLGKREAWLLFAECLMIIAVVMMAYFDTKNLWLLAWSSALLAFASATHDLALDALRIEWSTRKNHTALTTVYQAGYRLGMLWSGAGALAITAWLEAHYTRVLSWKITYLTMAPVILLGVVALCFSRQTSIKKERKKVSGKSLKTKIYLAALRPLQQFFKRFGYRNAVILLLLIALYKTSDLVMTTMIPSLYIDLGFSKAEIAAIAKVYGVLVTIVGFFCGGLLLQRMGVLFMLWLGALLCSSSNLVFAWLATQGASIHSLTLAISIENFCDGIAGTAWVAYLSLLTDRRYTATQYAFLSAFWASPKLLSGFSGVAVNYWGYQNFFIATAALGIPTIILIFFVTRILKSMRPSEL